MKTFAAVALLAAAVYAQDISNLPRCAINCFLTTLSADGCEFSDFACHCSQPGIVADVQPCVQGSCTPAEEAEVISQVQSVCAAAGVTLALPGPSSAPPATSTVVETSTVAETTVVETMPSVATMPSLVVTTTAAETVTAEPSFTDIVITSEIAPTETMPEPSQYTGAAAANAAGFVGAAVVAVAALAL